MASKTTVGVLPYCDTYLWSIFYQPLWWMDDDWNHPNAKKPLPQDLEGGVGENEIPLLRSLDNLLSINLGEVFPYGDVIAGVQITISDIKPDPSEFSDVEHWSEVSIQFEAHKDAEDWEGTLASYGGREPSVRHPELRDLKIPPGTWRVRAEATTAPGGRNDIHLHVDQILSGDYESGKGTWDALPFQLKLWFWPETELRPATYSPTEQKLADRYELAEQAYIHKWKQEKGIT